METDTQAVIFAEVHLWERRSAPVAEATGERPAPRLEPVERNQLLLRPVDVERLIAPAHPARAIWALVGSCDLSRFYEKIEAVEGGRDARPATRSCCSAC